MSAWKLVVHFMLPPPLILTILLVIPVPRLINKALLQFAKKILFCNVLNGIKLVHLMLLITGMLLIGSGVHTHQLRIRMDPDVSGHKRTEALARIWREERNFWISVLTFLLWGLLYRFYNLMMEHLSLKDKIAALEAKVKSYGSEMTSSAAHGVPPARPQPPSAPPEEELKGRDMRKDGKQKAT
ncbi:hypothetical protein CEUSTIGMA_g1374.t1 [Chlamydomonas eustigma]|uniref:BAP29/BAP31 transmembrane domain-containing protein n=1 Tax=Chlamydomonas eustigma TaxID=1157962 RepID=A0A250WSW4_9CHLO|nr:hypothetical protein CEUSTIGMA_g1374.t1 [Chlamydomonas eustigma]|eukprot:GAX73924.1 hypothetical protein CEUSTIGMA_g1374.t1 [Chlamydomonas eustigma]